MKRYKSGDLQVSDAGFGTIFVLKKRKKKKKTGVVGKCEGFGGFVVVEDFYNSRCVTEQSLFGRVG